MATQAAYSWQGLTLAHRTVLTGVDLSPEWALVRVRRALDEDHGEAEGSPSQGHMGFDEVVSHVSLTGSLIPRTVSGEVRAEAVPNGIAVIATASLVPLVVGLLVSPLILAAIFSWRGGDLWSTLWIWLPLLLLTAGLHLRQIARVLRVVTTAGTTL